MIFLNMLISVDIAHIKNHFSILQQEYREARALEEYLACWRDQATVDGLTDIGFIDRHLRIVQNQITYIQRRISWLESVVDTFSELKYKTADLFANAEYAVKHSSLM